jgi:hypothetical protein
MPTPFQPQVPKPRHCASAPPRLIHVLNDRDIEIKYKFQNKKMSTLAMEFKKKEYCNLPLSSMNQSGDYISSSD